MAKFMRANNYYFKNIKIKMLKKLKKKHNIQFLAFHIFDHPIVGLAFALVKLKIQQSKILSKYILI